MNLLAYFSPFNVYNISMFFLAVMIFDATGVLLASKLKFPDFLRMINWVFGLAPFVGLWFVLHLFIPFSPNFVMVSLISLGVITLPYYFFKMKYLSLFKQIIVFPFPLLFLLPIFKSLFFLTSLPPYQWDELAYHFYAPAMLATEQTWPFVKPYSCNCWGLYEMIPHFLETAFTLFLSLTSTYATSRLLHLAIFISVVSVVGVFLKRNFNLLVAILFVFFAYYLNPTLLTSSTLGYIDSAVSTLAVLYLVTGVNFLITKQKGDLLAAVAIASIALAIKYSVLSFIAAATLILGIFALIMHRSEIANWMRKKDKLNASSLKLIAVLAATALVFGGYWYVKNAVITGNPIYPFLFSCKPEFKCGAQEEFFAGWSIPFEWKNFQVIQNDLFVGFLNVAQLFNIAAIATPILGIIFKKKRLVILSLAISATLLAEVFLTSKVTSYVGRYFLHWGFLIPLVLALPFTITIKWSAPKLWYTVSLVFFLAYSYKTYQIPYLISRAQMDKIRSESYVAPEYRNYARYRYSLTEWIHDIFPNTDELILWCGESRPMTKLLVADPSLIWSSYEGMMRGFLVNCEMIVLPVVEPADRDKYIENLKQKYPDAYIASFDTCHPDVPTLDEAAYDFSYRNHYELNQKLICPRIPVRESMYKL
jgi:hypothetical protein